MSKLYVIFLIQTFCLIAFLSFISSDNTLTNKAYKIKRVYQMEAVKDMYKQKSYEKQFLLIELAVKQLFLSLRKSHEFFTKNEFSLIDFLPANETYYEDYISVLANIAFISELSLRFPDQLNIIIKRAKDIRIILDWAMNLALMSKIIPEVEIEYIHIGSQQLGIVEKQANFTNPFYQQKKESNNKTKKNSEEKKKVKRNKRKKGPSLSKLEL